MLSDDQSRLSESILGILFLGIIYQSRFRDREDWTSLSNIFSSGPITTQFLQHSRVIGQELHFSLQGDHDGGYSLLGAQGQNRLHRLTAPDTLIFELPSGGFEASEFYLYPLEVDFSLYRALPPFLARILMPFEDYFELETPHLELSGRSVSLRSPTICARGERLTLSEMTLYFGKHYDFEAVCVKSICGCVIELNAPNQSIVFRQITHQYRDLSLRFDDLSGNLSAVFEFIKKVRHSYA